MRARLLAVALLLLAVSAAAARLDLDDDGDDSDVLEELLHIDEEAERGALDGGKRDGGGGAEAVRRAQSMVLVLDNDNARRAVGEHAELLLLGYAPWCERSAQLMPRFSEAAAALREMGSAIAFAKLDGERYPKAASAVGVKGFSTVLLFVNGTERAYTGLHTNYLGEKEDRRATTEYEEFVKAATTENEVQFVETNDRDVAKILFLGIASEEQFLGLAKSEPEKFEKFGIGRIAVLLFQQRLDLQWTPDVVTAKQQEVELQRVANTLPENMPSSEKRFTDKTLLSLKNNPAGVLTRNAISWTSLFVKFQSNKVESYLILCWPREHVLEFFESMGFKCPDRKGVADFLQENDIGEYTVSYLLKQHVDRAKKIRAGLQRERLRRIERYKQRLALLLPPPSELGKYDGLP